jgi:hypothetical protein
MNRSDDKPTSTGQRKSYTTPRLISYGSVKDLVQGGGGSGKDSDGHNTKSCWIAEALYGIHDPRTALVRAWVSDIYVHKRRGWLLAALYIRIGRQTAELIHHGYLPRRWFRLVFDALVEKAFDESAVAIKAAVGR